MAAKNCLSDDQISAYLSGNVSEAEMIRFGRHLAECPRCQRDSTPSVGVMAAGS